MVETLVEILKKSSTEIHIDGVERGRYRVFTNGQIYDSFRGSFRKEQDNGYGYKNVAFYIGEGKYKIVYIHRLVCKSFLPQKTLDGLEVNHKNHIKSDNYLDNLEWVTSSQNSVHSYKGGVLNRSKRGVPTRMLTKEEIVQVTNRLCSSQSLGEISRTLGKSRTTISSLVNGRSNVNLVTKLLRGNGCEDEGCRCKKYLKIVENSC